MRVWILIFALMIAVVCVAASSANDSPSYLSSQTRNLQPNTLCAKDERVIFSCPIKSLAKIVSICASKDLTSDRGYLQYRFGLPGKIELEFPKELTGTQQKFQYNHYFRAQFDLTEINFTIDGYKYSVFDDYNGEEKPAVSRQGVTVNQPGTGRKEVSFVCRIPKLITVICRLCCPAVRNRSQNRLASRVHAAFPAGLLERPFYGRVAMHNR